MKIKIEKSELLNLLTKTQNIVEKRNTMPVLVNVLLEAKKDHLKIFATDLEVSLTAEAFSEVDVEGKAAVSAKNLFDIVKEFPEGSIQLTKKDNNWLEIKQGRSVFNIVGIAVEEYPIFPIYNTKEFSQITSDVLKDMIEKTIYSVSTDETRYHLNGVFFEIRNEAGKSHYRMVSTDGHRLSLIERDAGEKAINNIGSGVIIPRKGLNEIRKMLDKPSNIEIAIEGSQIIVKENRSILMIRLIEGKYPNYKQLIPQSSKKIVQISKEQFLSSLKRVSLVSNQKSKGIALNIEKHNIEISSNNPDLGDAKEDLETSYQGDDLKVGFNAKYLIDVLNNLNDDIVSLELNDHTSPALLRSTKDDSYLCVVMPMRL